MEAQSLENLVSAKRYQSSSSPPPLYDFTSPRPSPRTPPNSKIRIQLNPKISFTLDTMATEAAADEEEELDWLDEQLDQLCLQTTQLLRMSRSILKSTASSRATVSRMNDLLEPEVLLYPRTLEEYTVMEKRLEKELTRLEIDTGIARRRQDASYATDSYFTAKEEEELEEEEEKQKWIGPLETPPTPPISPSTPTRRTLSPIRRRGDPANAKSLKSNSPSFSPTSRFTRHSSLPPKIHSSNSINAMRSSLDFEIIEETSRSRTISESSADFIPLPKRLTHNRGLPPPAKESNSEISPASSISTFASISSSFALPSSMPVSPTRIKHRSTPSFSSSGHGRRESDSFGNGIHAQGERGEGEGLDLKDRLERQRTSTVRPSDSENGSWWQQWI